MHRSALRSCLLFLATSLISGCDPKGQPNPKAEAAAEVKPSAEARPPPKTLARHPKMAAKLAAFGDLPKRQDTGPLSWPVLVPVDKNQHAVPPKTASTYRPGKEARTALRSLKDAWFPQGRYIVGKNGTFTDNNGTVWHTVDHTPSNNGSNAGAGRDGSRSTYDADTGETIYHNKDGSTDIVDDDGTSTHIHSPNPNDNDTTDYVKNPDGSVTTYSDGYGSHVSKDGNDDYTDNPDGSRTVYHPDGSETTTAPDGTTFHQGPPGPGDKLGNPPSNKGPAWHNPPGDKPAGGNGEPHYMTRDGTEVTTQAAGEFVLVSGVPGHEVQARQQPWADSQTASAITAMAFRVGDSKVEVRLDGTALINGQPAVDGEFVQGEIPGGGAVGVWRNGSKMLDAVIIWPDLSVAWITRKWAYLSFVLQWRDKAPDHRGLLGSNDENPANDLTARDGTLHNNDPAGIAAFVESWRVTDGESLFTYGPGESTATYTLKDFPHPAPVPDQKAALAATAVLPAGPLRDMCVYDIAMTGDIRFVNAYQEYGALHGAVAANTAKKTEPQSALHISDDERKNARPREPNSRLKETLTTNQSVVYKLTTTEAAEHGALSNALKAPETYKPGMPGYAYFDEKGNACGKPVPAWNDMPSLKLPPGTHYLKLWGPGLVDITTSDYGK